MYILLMLFSIVFNYLAGIQISDYRNQGNDRSKKSVFVFTLTVNIAVLFFFKYYGFVFININRLFGLNIPIKELSLPIGISFYTFQILSYVIDVYRGNVEVQTNFIDFGTYVAMFPQLIAGPIVQYADIEEQLKHRKISFAKTADGMAWFIRGLGKKVLLANNIGILFETIFAVPAPSRPALTTWIGIIAYTFQIYFDFSGYSDMAIGLGKMIGFNFCINFDYPYVSKSVTEFWRRWHISLGTWFREYVYIPLGGNRVSAGKHIRNILIVWGLTGLWHGADWCFIIWGLYFGVILLLEKYGLQKLLDKVPVMVGHLYTIIAFIIGWMIFTAPSLNILVQNIASMVGALGNGFANSDTIYYLTTNLILLIVCGFCSTPIVWTLFKRIVLSFGKKGQYIAIACYAVLFITSFAYLVNATYNPFLYFKF